MTTDQQAIQASRRLLAALSDIGVTDEERAELQGRHSLSSWAEAGGDPSKTPARVPRPKKRPPIGISAPLPRPTQPKRKEQEPALVAWIFRPLRSLVVWSQKVPLTRRQMNLPDSPSMEAIRAARQAQLPGRVQ